MNLRLPLVRFASGISIFIIALICSATMVGTSVSKPLSTSIRFNLSPQEASASASAEILDAYPSWVRRNICESNAYSSQNPSPGKIIRFQTPIDINPNGNPQAREAIRYLEAMTDGAITFRLTNFDPAVGIVVVEGDAIDRDGSPGLGCATSSRDPRSGLFPKVTEDGILDSLLYVHLGSSQRNHALEGFQPYSIAEHELTHALGLINHFPGFTGIEGTSLESLVTLTALYRVPPGTDISAMCAMR